MNHIEMLNQENPGEEDSSNVQFVMFEFKAALKCIKMSSSGKDQVCYIMMKQLEDALLLFYNRIYQEAGKNCESRERPH